MADLLELFRGSGRADIWVRSVLLALVLAVSVTLVWVTVHDPGRRLPTRPAPSHTSTLP